MAEGSATLACLGAIAGAYGVTGEVRLKSFCAVPEDIAAYGTLVTEDGRAFDVALGPPIKAGFAARLSGIRPKEEADALRGTRLHVPRNRLPPTAFDEYYHIDLIGLVAVDTGGTPLGRVTAVIEQGAGELLEIRQADGGESVLVPFTRGMVPTVDIAAGRVVVDPPDGLLAE